MKNWVVGVKGSNINFPRRCSCCNTEYPGKTYRVTSEDVSFDLPLCRKCKEHIEKDSMGTTGCVFITLLVIVIPLATWAGTNSITTTVGAGVSCFVIAAILGYFSLKKASNKLTDITKKGCTHFMEPIGYRYLDLKRDTRPVHLFTLNHGKGSNAAEYPYWVSFLQCNVDNIVFYEFIEKDKVSERHVNQSGHELATSLEKIFAGIAEKDVESTRKGQPIKPTKAETFEKMPAAEEMNGGAIRLNRPGDLDDSNPNPGDVFMMPLKNGLWGACRVIRRGDPDRRHPNDFMGITENGLLVMATTWIGIDPPELSDPRLRTPLIKTFGGWKSEAEISWITKPLPDNFRYIGSFDPSIEELRIDCNESGGWEWLAEMVEQQHEWDRQDPPEVIVEDDMALPSDEYKDEELWYAAENGEIKALKAAIKAGANLNAHNGTNTALMRAANSGNIEAVKLLLEAGADPNIQNSGGDTALTWAQDHPEIAALLEGVTDPLRTTSITQFSKMLERD